MSHLDHMRRMGLFLGLLTLGLAPLGCDQGCIVEGEDGERDKANLDCLPDEGDESYSCEAMCALAASCPEFPADYDTGECTSQCEGAKYSPQPAYQDDYYVGIACIYSRGGPSCNAFSDCADKTGVPVPTGYWPNDPDWRVTRVQRLTGDDWAGFAPVSE